MCILKDIHDADAMDFELRFLLAQLNLMLQRLQARLEKFLPISLLFT